MRPIKKVSRRSFIKGIGLASGGLIIACNTNSFSNDSTKKIDEFNPNVFIQLNSDGSFPIGV